MGGVRVQALETLGHASHHHAYLVEGLLFAGDIAGVRIAPGPVLPPTPPPDIHLESWYAPWTVSWPCAPRPFTSPTSGPMGTWRPTSRP